ncbi:MAG: S41 family peptidase [Candidatus Zixiibacteriota bacterium]
MNSISSNELRKSSSRKWKFACIFLVILLVSLAISAGSQEDDQDKIIDSEIQAEIIDSVTQALNENYVYPEVAKEMELYVRKLYTEKKYEKITSLREFTLGLTDDLQEISKDKHLWVRFGSDELLARFESDTLTDEEKKRELEEKRRNNFCFKEIKLLQGNVGYIDLRCFSNATDAGLTIIAAMNFLAYADAIIFDLRENGGGDPSTGQLISSYLFKEPVHLNSLYFPKSDSIWQLWTQAYVEGPRLTEVDIYILSSSYTFSGAEEFTYNLKNLKRATIIGEITGGGANWWDYKIFKNLNIGIALPHGRPISPITGANWEGTGVTPDIPVPQEKALDVAHLQALEKFVEKTEDSDQKARLQWTIEGKKAILNPVTVELSVLRKYEGQYGPRKIWIEGDELYYQREDRPKYKLTPMGDNWFMIKELDYFRIQFVADENGEFNELIGHLDDGYTDSHKRNK